VAAYDGYSSLNNTFHLVLATDGKLSFLVFNFGIMSWPNSFGYNQLSIHGIPVQDH
jgi:hypothetical protein